MFKSKEERNKLRILGVVVAILSLWNGVCDLIYVYSPDLSGLDHFSSKLFTVIGNSGGRSHFLVMVAQTAGWLYPIYALSYYHWYVGMKESGSWILSALPNVLIAYAVIMIGGVQHAGWAYLSVLNQAKAIVGCSDDVFFDKAQRFIIDHFVVSDLTAIITLNIGLLLHSGAILSGKTYYPRWFILCSPLGVVLIAAIFGLFLPAGPAGFVIVPFGTWLLFFPTVASTMYLWNAPVCEEKKEI